MQTFSPLNAKINPFTVSLGNHGPAWSMAELNMQLDNPLGTPHADLDYPIQPTRAGRMSLQLVRKNTEELVDSGTPAIGAFVEGGDVTVSGTDVTMVLKSCKRLGGALTQRSTHFEMLMLDLCFLDFSVGADTGVPDGSTNYSLGWSIGHS